MVGKYFGKRATFNDGAGILFVYIYIYYQADDLIVRDMFKSILVLAIMVDTLK